MALDIEGVVGTDNMDASAKEAVIALLRNTQQPATVKRYLFARWARVVGLLPTRDDLNSVAPWKDAE